MGLRRTFLTTTHKANLLIYLLKSTGKLRVTNPPFIYESDSLAGVAANILTHTAVSSSTYEEE